MMKKISEYEQHAEECRQLADAARTDQHREMLSSMAETWLGLAEGRRQKLLKNGRGGDD